MREDVGNAIAWLVTLGELALGHGDPFLAHQMTLAAVLVAVGRSIEPERLANMQRRAVDPEASGPSRRCYGFLVAVLEGLGLVMAPQPQSTQLGLPGVE